MKIKFLILFFVSILLTNCNEYFNTYTQPVKTVENHELKIKNLIKAKISVRNNFNLKANFNGSPPAQISDIKSFKAYLITSASSIFPSGGDPLDPANIVFGPINIDGNSDTEIRFSNVPATTETFGSGNYYHIAVRAFDNTNGTGNEIIKNNNGDLPWTGNTVFTPKVAVSNGVGIQVLKSTLAISDTTPLPIIINLNDGIGASVDMNITLNGGIPGDVNSYVINLCTNSTMPVTTKLLTPSMIQNSGTAFLESGNIHKINLSGLLPGTYYATASAFSAVSGGGSNLTQDDNGGIVYSGADTGSKVAVSINTLTVNPDYTYTFSNGTFFDIQMNL